MGQGIYWVQRERAQTRARSSSEQQAHRFNERYGRITRQFTSVFAPYAGETGTISVVVRSPLDSALDSYNELKAWIDANVDDAKMGDLSKLATAAKRILVEIAKREGWPYQWDAANKSLMVRGATVDFS